MFRTDDQNVKRIIDELNAVVAPIEESISAQYDRSLRDFPIPIRISNHDDYDKTVKNELNRYVQSVENTPALMKESGLLEDVQEVVGQLLRAIEYERRGDTECAKEAIKVIIERYADDSFFVSELNSSYAFRGVAPFKELRCPWENYEKMLSYQLTFFRCREKEVHSRREMLHVPLSKRSKSSSNRFSLPGIPCLYIASTTFCCWNELGKPKNMSAACFRVNTQGDRLKILNLVVNQNLINGADWNPFVPMSETVKRMRILFPLVISTSVSTNEMDAPGYKPEYTISHLIMRCLKELKIDGVAYLSARIDDEFQYPHGVNVAIPVFSESTQHELGDICRCFEMTDPMYFSCSTDDKLVVEEGGTESYVNAVFSQGFSGKIKQGDSRVRYTETLFSGLDNILSGQQHFGAFEE